MNGWNKWMNAKMNKLSQWINAFNEWTDEINDWMEKWMRCSWVTGM